MTSLPLPPRISLPTNKKRKPDGQKGHPRHERQPFTTDDIDHWLDYRWNHFPDCGGSLRESYEELLRLLPEEDILNVDETGHKDNGQRLWTWCFRASLFTLFKIPPSRGSQVLVEVLGKEFDGVLGCDYFSAYRKYMKDFDVRVQFCLAHFIRDVKFLAEHPNAANRAYGARLLVYLRKLFGIIHRREQYASDQTFRQALEKVMADLVWSRPTIWRNKRYALWRFIDV